MSDTEQSIQSEVAAPEPAPQSPATDAVIEGWFVETFFNRPLPDGLYNHIYAAKQILQARVAAAVAGKV